MASQKLSIIQRSKYLSCSLHQGYLVLIFVWASLVQKIFFAQKFINSSIQKCCLCGVQNCIEIGINTKRTSYFLLPLWQKWSVDGASFFLFQLCKYFLFIIHLTEVLCLYKVILLLYTSMVEYTHEAIKGRSHYLYKAGNFHLVVLILHYYLCGFCLRHESFQTLCVIIFLRFIVKHFVTVLNIWNFIRQKRCSLVYEFLHF